ncbi:NRAMP family divalent metal transporter [Natrinema gelatinilyticum]|uniref:NRAMP family divalent metal transporter n=1 Tax=Natrinema gelatinilyticum TaxID=2961571 RepID=UPI0020C45A9D|nr:divalent metal cation transporter [Natrinema gelatinilyticum]
MSGETRFSIWTVDFRNVGEYLREMGPSWVAGAIAAGPATMASLITAGATFGYDMLWVVVLSAVLGGLTQYLAMRLGLFTESGIVSVVESTLGETWATLLVIDAVLASGLAQLIIMKTVADISATVTGIDARIWGLVWAVTLAVGLAGRGYRFLELLAKGLVSVVVVAFVVSLFLVPIDARAAATGLVPTVPGGLNGALVAAGILGGAVHITLITMQSYTMRAREWTSRNYALATFDIGASMLVAFGVYSLAIFLVTASVLHTPAVEAATLTAIQAAQTLGPLAGANAKWLFLLGLWGAAVSTLGGNTIVPPYLVADKLGWDTDISDNRYRGLLVAVSLLSAGGVFVGGAFFPLLVLVLAFGLVGTPFALLLVLLLLNDPDVVPETNSLLANLGGLVVLVIASVLAGSFVREQAAGGLSDPVTVFVVGFATVFALASIGLILAFGRRRGGK